VKTSLAVLTIAFLVGASICLADTPGGYLVEAISDECDTVNPIWGPGLRGMPEFLFLGLANDVSSDGRVVAELVD
jgi:hypothetical protein